MNTRKLGMGVALALFVVGPAAAGDYLLELGGIKGEADGASGTIDVQSYSWGVHKAGGAATGQARSVGTGKASMSDLSAAEAQVQSPRDAASGQASGKRSASAAPGAGAADAAPKVGDVVELTVVAKDAGPRCVSGQHIATAVLTGSGKRLALSDVEVLSCEVTGGQRRSVYRGHVTVLK